MCSGVVGRGTVQLGRSRLDTEHLECPPSRKTLGRIVGTSTNIGVIVLELMQGVFRQHELGKTAVNANDH